MVELVAVSLTLIYFLIGWRIDLKWKLMLNPFMIFSAYYFLRVIPGFFYGLNFYGVDNLYSFIIPLSYFGFFMGYFFLLGVKSKTHYCVCDFAKKGGSGDYERLYFFSLFLLVVSGFILYKGMPPSISVAVDFAGNNMSASDAAAIISEARRSISKGHIFSSGAGSGVLREVVFCTAIVAVTSGSVYYFTNRNRRSLFLLFLAVFVSYFFVSGDGTRGRFVVVMTALIISYSIFCNLNVKKALLGLVLVVCLSILLGAYTNKMATLVESGAWGEIILSVLERIFIGNSINDAISIMSIESGYLDYGYGYWLARDFGALIPGLSVDKPLAYHLYLFHIGGDSTTYLTGTTISRAFVDGGIAGVVFYFFCLGLLSKVLWKIIFFVPFNYSQRAVLAICLWLAIGQGYVSGLPGVIFISAMVLLVILLQWSFLGMVTPRKVR